MTNIREGARRVGWLLSILGTIVGGIWGGYLVYSELEWLNRKVRHIPHLEIKTALLGLAIAVGFFVVLRGFFAAILWIIKGFGDNEK